MRLNRDARRRRMSQLPEMVLRRQALCAAEARIIQASWFFMARTSIGSIDGGLASISSARAIKAFAMLPPRCAWRSSSLLKASKTPKVVGDNLRANQIGVVASRLVISRPAVRKSAKACSIPGLASSRTKKACVIIFVLQCLREGFHAVSHTVQTECVGEYCLNRQFWYQSSHANFCPRARGGVRHRSHHRAR